MVISTKITVCVHNGWILVSNINKVLSLLALFLCFTPKRQWKKLPPPLPLQAKLFPDILLLIVW